MTDRPIIFSAPMVRALLAGSKTQTRRFAKFEAIADANLKFSGLEPDQYLPGRWNLVARGAGGCWNERTKPLKTAANGDRLWVRENWQHWPPNNRDAMAARPRIYAATDDTPKGPFPEWSNWADRQNRSRRPALQGARQQHGR